MYKTYEEATQAAKQAEYGWIKTEENQRLSDRLDRLMRLGFGLGERWRKIYREEGRETACMEVMYNDAITECEKIRKEQQRIIEEKERPLKEFKADNWHYLQRERLWPVTTLRAFEYVKKADADFIAKQRAAGFCCDDLKKQIAERQRIDADALMPATTWKLRQDQERQSKQAEQAKQTEEQAAALAREFEKVIQRLLRDIVASGVLNGR